MCSAALEASKKKTPQTLKQNLSLAPHHMFFNDGGCLCAPGGPSSSPARTCCTSPSTSGCTARASGPAPTRCGRVRFPRPCSARRVGAEARPSPGACDDAGRGRRTPGDAPPRARGPLSGARASREQVRDHVPNLCRLHLRCLYARASREQVRDDVPNLCRLHLRCLHVRSWLATDEPKALDRHLDKMATDKEWIDIEKMKVP